jgi:hypothetical protein
MIKPHHISTPYNDVPFLFYIFSLNARPRFNVYSWHTYTGGLSDNVGGFLRRPRLGLCVPLRPDVKRYVLTSYTNKGMRIISSCRIAKTVLTCDSMVENQGGTKRCRQSELTNSALEHAPNAERGAQINFGDLTTYLTYGWNCRAYPQYLYIVQLVIFLWRGFIYEEIS